jgi:hypothetical protein
MVRFEDNKILIEVKISPYPIDDWHAICQDIIEAVQNHNPENKTSNNYYFLLELLRQMQVEPKQVNK